MARSKSASRRSERRSDTRSDDRRDLGAAPTSPTSVPRLAVVGVLVALGVAWITVFLVAADAQTLPWMADLGRWNFLIGFGLIFTGMTLAAHPRTPLGRGRGVVVGMLGSFIIGLIWIVLYYVTGANLTIPLLSDLAQYNLLVGIGFMAVGFVYATHWE